MANGSGKPPAPPVAYYDFYKTNGLSSLETTTFIEGPSMTRQEFAEECDINTIMKRYESTGASINGLTRDPRIPVVYFDFAAAPQTLLEFMDMQRNAEASFMQLPAVVRKEFDNDPIQFVEYASDPANLGQMREWGLAPPAKPQDAPVAVPPAPAPKSGEAAPAASPAVSTHVST